MIEARVTLEERRLRVFPGYENAVNLYLPRFNAGFRLDHMEYANTRGGPTCTYNVLISDTPIAVAGADPQPGEACFRNTLSAGDRNTLALALFFASLDQEENAADNVVVIDDPISSLDEHRAMTTVNGDPPPIGTCGPGNCSVPQQAVPSAALGEIRHGIAGGSRIGPRRTSIVHSGMGRGRGVHDRA